MQEKERRRLPISLRPSDGAPSGTPLCRGASFFVSIGLKVHFIEYFNLTVVALVLVLAFVGKVVGAGIGARLGGMPTRRSLAVGFGLNARGAMEIIIGSLGYEAGLINEEVFVALIVVALVTSITSAPLMRFFLKN